MCIDGSTVTTLPDGRSGTFVGGLLAQQTNMGRQEENRFAVIPEFDLTVGWNLTPRLRATLGYTFIYWNNVLRAGDQIDSNLSQLPPEPPTGARAGCADEVDGLLAQGLLAGLDFSF